MFLLIFCFWLVTMRGEAEAKLYMYHYNNVFSVTSPTSNSTSFTGFTVKITSGITTLDTMTLSSNVTGYTSTWLSPTLTVTATSGGKSAAAITNVLNQVLFYTTSSSTAKRTFVWQFTGATSNPQDTVILSVDPPILQKATEVYIFDSITIPSSPDLASGFVVILETNVTGDELRFSAAGYNVTYTSCKLTVKLSSASSSVTVSDLALKIRTVRFYTTSSSTVTRRISFSMQSVGSSAMFYSSTGHFYEYADVPGVFFTAAQTACASKSVQGWSGYLATITSEVENNVLLYLGTHGFLGGSDKAVTGTWKWVTGPESGTVFYQNGKCVTYCAWDPAEPNNNAGNEHVLEIGYHVGALWNDVNEENGAPEVSGYFCEFGGSSGDAVLAYTAMGAVDIMSTVPVETPSPATNTTVTSAPITTTPAPPLAVECNFRNLSKTYCVQNSSCSWFESKCTLQCDRQSSSDCSSLANCAWDTSLAGCYVSYTTGGCAWGNKNFCAGVLGCAFDSTANACTPSPRSACEFGESYACIASGCKWETSARRCSQPLGCTSITTESACTATTLCTWKKTACVIATDVDAPPCRYGESAACTSNIDEACTWLSDQKVCRLKDGLGACASYNNKKACLGVPWCVYSGTQCVSRSSLYCPVDRVSCGGPSTGSTCSDVQLEVDCVLRGCAYSGYNVSTPQCLAKSTNTPCSYSTSTCTSVSGCVFSDSIPVITAPPVTPSPPTPAPTPAPPTTTPSPPTTTKAPTTTTSSPSTPSPPATTTKAPTTPSPPTTTPSPPATTTKAPTTPSPPTTTPSPPATTTKAPTTPSPPTLSPPTPPPATPSPPVTPSPPTPSNTNRKCVAASTGKCLYDDPWGCQAAPSCQWMASLKKCKQYSEIGLNTSRLCEMEAYTCITSANGMCEWQGQTCVPKRIATSGVCSNLDQMFCAAIKGCTWNSAVTPNGGCVFDKNTVMAPCDFYFASHCNEVVGCTWDSTLTKCKIATGSSTPCKYGHLPACVAVVGCAWVRDQGCVVAPSRYPCAYKDSSACRSFNGCLWSDTTCTIDLSITKMCGFEDIAACNFVQGCVWNPYKGMCTRSFTPPTPCGFEHPPACYGGCTWNNATGQCSLTLSFDNVNPCWYKDLTTCNRIGGCQWKDSVCTVTVLQIPCSQEEPAACRVAGCTWDSVFGLCKAVANTNSTTSSKGVCAFTDSNTCNVNGGCTWDVNLQQCKLLKTTVAPCAFSDVITCGLVNGCGWIDNKCRVNMNVSGICPFADRGACNSVTGCQYNDQRSLCEAVGTKTPCDYTHFATCEGLSGCYWDSTKSACAMLHIESSCAYEDQAACTFSSRCQWNNNECNRTSVGACIQATEVNCVSEQCYYDLWVCTAVQSLCSANDTATACSRYASCTYDTTQKKCRSLAIDCGLHTSAIVCTKSSCVWDNVKSSCSRHPAVTDVFPPEFSMCSNGTSRDSCYTVAIDCYWNMYDKYCQDVRTIAKSITPVAGYRPVPAEPQPNATFRLELYGKDIALTNPVLLLKNVTECPASTDLLWSQTSKFRYTVTDYDSPRQMYAVRDINLDLAQYMVCIRANTSQVVQLDSGLYVRRVAPTLKTFSIARAPYGNESFIITFTGNNFQSENYYAFTLKGTACPSDKSKYKQVATLSSEYNKCEGNGYLTSIGEWIVCYSDFQGRDAQQFSATINIIEMAPWLDEGNRNEVLRKLSGLTVTYPGSITTTFSAFSTTRYGDNSLKVQNVLLFPGTGSIQYGDLSAPYPANDVGWFIVAPLQQQLIVQPFLTVVLKSVNTWDSDTVSIFVPEGGLALACSKLTTETVCLHRGCSWKNEVCIELLPTMTSCPTSISNFMLYSTFSGTSFTEVLESESRANIRIPVPVSPSLQVNYAVVVVCTRTTQGSGVLASYEVTSGNFCPDGCQLDGVQRGECSQKATNAGGEFSCKCDVGYAGPNCNQRTQCTGSTPLTEISTDRVIQVNAGAPCSYVITPNVLLSNLERMEEFVVAVQITDVKLGDTTSTNAPGCTSPYITIRDGSIASGQILTSSCTDTPIVLTTGPAGYIAVNPPSNSGGTGTFKLRYKVLSTICPGERQNNEIHPQPLKRCGGPTFGECVDITITPTTDIDTLSNYKKDCFCTTAFAKPKTSGSCSQCAFGYRQDTFPNCTSAFVCLSSTECNNNGYCSADRASSCTCSSHYFGSRCQESVPSDVVFEKPKDLLLRFSFDTGAANTALSSSDPTILPCALNGSKFDCVFTPRTRGRNYRLGGAGSTQASSSAAAPKSRLQPSTPAPTQDNDVDVGLSFNRAARGNVFSDLVKTAPVTSTDLDISEEFSVMAWVRVDRKVNGFLVAKIDNVFTKEGTSPILDDALNDVQDRAMSSENIRLGRTNSLHSYLAIHLNGDKQFVSVLFQKGNREANRDAWLVVRHFRLGGSESQKLFDGTWRYVAIIAGYSGGRYEAQIFVDAKSVASDRIYTQCLPFLPKKVDDKSLNSANTTKYNLVPGGAFVVGYHFQGDVDELRLYNKRMDPYVVVAVGGPTFLGELLVNQVGLYTAGSLGIVILAVCICHPIWYNIRIKILVRYFGDHWYKNEDEKIEIEKEKAEEELKKQKEKEEDQQRKEKKAKIALEAKETKEAEALAKDTKIEDVKDEDVHDTISESARSSAKEPSEKGSSGKSDGAAIHAVALPGQIDSEDERLQKEAKEEEEKKKKEEEEKKKKKEEDLMDRAGKLKQGADTTGAEQVGKVAADTGGTANEVTSHESVIAKIAIFLGRVIEVSKDVNEYLLRVNLINLSFQAITLYFYSFTFPQEFTEWWGTVTSIVSFDFTKVYKIDINIAFYLVVVTSIIAFFVLLTLRLMEEEKSLDAIYAQHIADRDERIKAQESSAEYEPKKAGWKEKIAGGSLLVLNMLYLPVTKQSIEILVCHRNVQCAFDCFASDQSFWTAFGFAIAAITLITLGTPVMLLVLIKAKTKEFEFIFKKDSSAEKTTKEIVWKTYLQDDHSSYNTLYSGFEFNWRYFSVVLMLVKVLMCIPVLVIEPDSVLQLSFVLVIQGTFTLVVFRYSPFLMRACDIIMCIGQGYVLFCVSLTCFYRADPTWEGWGTLMNVVSVFALISQLYFLIVNNVRNLCG